MRKNAIVPRNVLFDPFECLVDDWINTINGDVFFKNDTYKNSSFPRVNVYHEGSTHLCVDAAIPGYTPEDVKVEVDEESRTLTISGSASSREKVNDKFVVREIKLSNFTRSFTFTDEYDLSSAKASFKDGILSLKILRKDPEVRTKRRQIQIE